MKGYRSVFSFRYGIFDMDGTLIDSMQPCLKIFADLVASYGLDEAAARDSFAAATSAKLTDIFRQTINAAGDNPTDKEIASLFLEFERRIRLVPIDYLAGAKRLLRALAGKGVTIFVSSGSPDETVSRRLGSELARGRFKLTLGSTAIPKGPLHIQAFADAAGVCITEFARDCFYCGDSEMDMLIGHRFDLYTVGVLGTITAERLRAAGARRVIPGIDALLADPR
ncbi:MAG: HAD hydrolase-like protein [Patescibacteria group bacterium]|jgi:phosphoglycolate phosphatase-like HAD superfamily hydrolase